MSDTYKWDGDWPPFMEWLDEVAGGKMRIPLGHTPPITVSGRNLVVRNRNDMFVVKPGESVRIDKELGEFFKAEG